MKRNSVSGAKRVLVLGASGQLGSALRCGWPPGVHLCLAQRRLASSASLSGQMTDARTVGNQHICLDITDFAAVSSVMAQFKPTHVINAAAFTDVDGAQTQEAQAFAVNAHAVANLAALCKAHGSYLLHISTDYVFSGQYRATPLTVQCAPKPQGVYARSKLAGEMAVLGSGCCGMVVRTSWLYSAHTPNFITKLWERLQRCSRMYAAYDSIGTLTTAEFLARGLRRVVLCASPTQTKLFHLAGRGAVSRYALAVFVAQYLRRYKLACSQVLPVPRSAFERAANVPAYSGLCSARFAAKYGLLIPAWHTLLWQLCQQLRARQAGTSCQKVNR